MNAAEWLERGRAVEDEILVLNEALKSAWETVTSISSSIGNDKVMKTAQNDSKLVNFVGFVEEIEKQKDRLFAIKKEVLSVIFRLKNKRARTLLICRYVNNKSEDEIEYDLSCCRTTVNKIHNLAIKEVEQILISEGLL